jgi:type I restriction enzyme R subunit
MDKYLLNERDAPSKLITPALHRAGWTLQQFHEEVRLTDGRVQVCGNLGARIKNPEAAGGPKRADYVHFGIAAHQPVRHEAADSSRYLRVSSW